MATQSRAGKKLPKRAGQRSSKYTRYYAVTAKVRKLRRILKRNGAKAAEAWADAHQAQPEFFRLTR